MKYWRQAMLVLFAALLSSTAAHGDEEDDLELETARIKANKELPQILYIVPWKDFEAPDTEQRKLRLHNFFGDLYEPMLVPDPSQTSHKAD